MPVWPTWSVCGRQPALVTTREQPTAPPSSPASSSMIAKPSAEPTPRPPRDDDLGLGQRDAGGRRLRHARRPAPACPRAPAGRNVSHRRARRPRAAATAWGATVSSAASPCSRRSSRGCRPSALAGDLSGSPPVDRDAVGGQRQVELAATCASTSFPRRSRGADHAPARAAPSPRRAARRSRRLRDVGRGGSLRGSVVDRRRAARARGRPGLGRTRAPAAALVRRPRRARPGAGRSCDPQRLQHLDQRRRRVGAVAQDSACLPWPSGSASRSFSSRGSASAGVLAAIGLRCARSRPAPTGSAAG